VSAPRPARQGLSLLELFLVLRRRAGLIAAILAIGCGASFAAVSLVPPTYVARARLLLEPDRGRPGESTGLTQTFVDGALVDSQVQILTSRSLARDIVVDLGLMEDPEFRTPPLSPGRLLASLWRRLAGAPDAGAGTESAEEAAEDPTAELVDRFLERLTVAREGRTYVIAVSFEATDPEKAARLANAVAEHYLLAQLATKIDGARQTAAWLAERLAAAKAQHEADLAALAAFRERAAAGPERGDRDGERLVQLERELVAAGIERAAKEARIARLKEQIRRGEPIPRVEELGSSTLLENLNALKAQSLRREAELKAEYGDRHPKIVDVRRELAELQARIEAEQAALLREQEGLVLLARAKEQALQRELDRLKAHAAERERIAQELQTLQQKAEISRRLYESLLAQVERTAQGEAMQRPDARIISEAVPPSAPTFPRPRLVLSVALTVSLIVALVAVHLAELAEKGFRTGEDLREGLGLVPLAILPRLPRRGEHGPEAHVVERPTGRFAEGIRAVLPSLLGSSTGRPGRVVLVTSCLPGEGKTTLAMCLGRLAASEGLRTLLIDADLRRPRIGEFLGTTPRPGLVELLRGESTLEHVLAVDAATGLVVLPGSPRLARPTRLLGPDGLGRLLAACRKRFDLVLVDSAPLRAVADARLIAPLVDRALLVVRWGTTPRELVAAALADAPELEGKLAGAILNRVDVRKAALWERPGSRTVRAALAGYYGD